MLSKILPENLIIILFVIISKKNNTYSFYFSLNLYSGNNLENEIILFKPQIGLNDTNIILKRISSFPQKIPLYGELSIEKIGLYDDYKYYLSIKSFEIVIDYDFERIASDVTLLYCFSDENFEENYLNKYRIISRMPVKNNITTYDLTIKVEAKYLLFVCLLYFQNVLIKNIKKDDIPQTILSGP